MPPVLVINGEGLSPFVLACDHASNRIPEHYDNLGLSPAQRLMHIAWDPGAFAVAVRLSELLDAPLVASTVSRLVVDCNRHHNAPDLIPVFSERTEIPGNSDIGDNERADRIGKYHSAFHDALRQLMDRRQQKGIPTLLATIHSFTPIYKDVRRPWPIGLIHGHDTALTEALRDALADAEPGMNIGWNEPYSALNGVTYTLEHHGGERGIEATMIEIRHDEILETDGVERWALLLADCLGRAGRARIGSAPGLASAEVSLGA